MVIGRVEIELRHASPATRGELRRLNERRQRFISVVRVEVSGSRGVAIGTEYVGELVGLDRRDALRHVDRERRAELGIRVLHAERQ